MAEHRVGFGEFRARAGASCRRSTPSACATSASSCSPCGRNSCSGGSSRRIVTGSPAMMREELDEILALERQQLVERGAAAAPRRRAMIIWRTAPMRVGVEEHVLGAAEADALGAELARGFGVERGLGVGAHRACGGSRRPSPSGCRNRPTARARSSRRQPTNTSPVAPSSVMVSPPRTVLPPADSVCAP